METHMTPVVIEAGKKGRKKAIKIITPAAIRHPLTQTCICPSIGQRSGTRSGDRDENSTTKRRRLE
jgi:hypothetical protein